MYRKDDKDAAEAAVRSAFDEAVERHPNWDGESLAELTLILAEECGEAIQVVNDISEYSDDPEMQRDLLMHYVVEVSQVGAVALRILAEIHRRDRG